MTIPDATYWSQVFSGMAIGALLDIVVEVTRMTIIRGTSRTARKAEKPASPVVTRLFLAFGRSPLMSP